MDIFIIGDASVLVVHNNNHYLKAALGTNACVVRQGAIATRMLDGDEGQVRHPANFHINDGRL